MKQLNNDLGRKVTSLTLMVIMVAGGLTFTIPGVMPVAHAANANLFVSAENSQFDNYMSGPQVIEVVVIDSNISDTTIPLGEPDVTVNGNMLRMVQGVDGNWYGYFADRDMAQIADSTVINENGVGLDYGDFCNYNDGNEILGFSVSDTVGFAVSNTGEITGTIGSSTGGEISNNCIFSPGTPANTLNVLRESKEVNPGNGNDVWIGQIGLNSVDNWPFIQLYELNPASNVIVQYNYGGGVQSTTLTFDTVDNFAVATMDRTVYTRDSQVHLTITDIWLNIDPTDEDSWTFGTVGGSTTTNYQVFDENGIEDGAAVPNGIIDVSNNFNDLMIEDNGVLILNVDVQISGTNVVTIQDTLDTVITCSIPQDISTCTTSETAAGLGINSQPITITEQGPNSGVFATYDESDESVLLITDSAQRGTSAIIDYNESPISIVVGFDFATIDIQPIDNEWNSGEEIPVILVDGDANKNSRADEDLEISNPDVELIPSLQTGNPFTLSSLNNVQLSGISLTIDDVQAFSQRAILTTNSDISLQTGDVLVLTLSDTFTDLYASINEPNTEFRGFNFLNYDLRSIDNSLGNTIISFDIDITDGVNTARIGNNIVGTQGFFDISDATGHDIFAMNGAAPVQIIVTLDTSSSTQIPIDTIMPIVVDFFSFGIIDDGLQSYERIANQIIRIEVEETGDNTGIFEGSLEYKMLNQINILDESTYSSLSPITDDPTFIVIEDLTDEYAPRVNYFDLGRDGVSTQIADQEEAPSHSGVISFNSNNYKAGDNVDITLVDMDLNADSDLIDIFTVVDPSLFPTDPARDTVGKEGLGLYSSSLGEFGRLVDVTFDDHRWTSGLAENGGSCGALGEPDDGLSATGFTLVETGASSGVFVGSFDIPLSYCNSDTGLIEMTIGADIEINYVDFRDTSGEIIEIGDSAGIRANTGSVSLDRTVYPVPWGQITDFDDPLGDQVTPAGSNPDETRSLDPIHATGITDGDLDEEHETLGNGDVIIHVRVTDPDFDLAEFGEDTIEQDVKDSTVGPVKISIIRDSEEIILGYAGGSTPNTNGVIDVNADATGSELDDILQLGAIHEIAPDAGIFEIDFTIRYTDGPDSTLCPDTDNYVGTDGATQNTDPLIRFDTLPMSDENFCILQGDIITVEYTDPADASGEQNIVTDSATFDLRNGVLQSDKSVYKIGSDMILTLIEPDFDLDNDHADTYDLDLIQWDSDAATLTIGDAGGQMNSFDPEPTDFRETGDSTGIFQVVLEIPQSLSGNNLERGEEIILEYADWSPALGNYVGEQKIDVNITIFTSNFGATVELDQKLYTWTDKVYITIVAPDHNLDGDLIDEIGNISGDPIKIATRGHDLNNYKLVETGTDTGIFTGEVILTGFYHDADGDTQTGNSDGVDTNPKTTGSGPSDGFLESDDDDGLTISFEFSEDEIIVGSALIRWNIGEVQWLDSDYHANTTGTVRVIDPDMNLDPENVDIFAIDVWSNYDLGGISLNVTETNEATGIFEGNLYFTNTDESSIIDSILRVSLGDTVAVEYNDHTLPDPYTTQDDISIIDFASIQGSSNPPTDEIISLDKSMYSWTDKVYITINSDEHNLDSNIVDTIGSSLENKIKISTRGHELDFYQLVETGTDTGIFTGEVILTGFTHDADGDTRTGDLSGNDVIFRDPSGVGPTGGHLPSDNIDGVSISFKISENETIVASSLIGWNIGEVQWLKSNYPVNGSGIVRVIDPDMNLNPEAIDNFDVDVWSDSDAGGINLTVTETSDAAGIFEGTVFFTTIDESSGHRLRISEGDTITADYEDNTLPDPYTTADELDLIATTVTVNEVNSAPVLASISDKTISLDTSLAFPLTATDADGDPLTYRSAGFIYHGETITRDGMFLWTPTNVGQYDFAISVSDGIASDTKTFRITVNNLVTIPDAPIVQIVSELNSNKCLNISEANSDNGANVIMWDCIDNAVNDKWTLDDSGHIVSELNNSKCLDISGANPNNGANVIMWTCHDGANQKWSVTESGYITSELNNKCLSISGVNPNNGTNVVMWDCVDGANQKWSTTEPIVPNAPEPIVQIVSELNSNKCLDISGANTNNGANVIMWECHDGANQKWSVTESGYITSDLNNSKCLDISGANPDNGANVIMWKCHDGANQKWSVTESGQIVSELNNKCLDISRANPDNGANVIMWTCHDGANQKWTY